MDIDQPNGDDAGSSRPSPFADVKLSVDAYTLDAASGKRRLKEIEPDGSLTFEEPKPPRVKATEELARIWNLYPGGMPELREADVRAADPSTEYNEPEPEEDKGGESREPGTLMSPAEMEKLRSEVVQDLNSARNELWWVLELAKTLASSASFTADPPPEPIAAAGPQRKKAPPPKTAAAPAPPAPPGAKTDEVPPILPPGTYTTTPAAPPERPAAVVAHELELALAAKAAALDDCAALIDAAVDELRLMNEAGTRWAAEIRALRLGNEGRGQWAVVPKPDFGRTGESAKDVVIPYALDEAPSSVHARSMAAFDLDPRKDALAFGARSYYRLRVVFRTGGSGGPQTASQPYDANAETGGAAEMLAAAQLETVDEELFNELRVEALRLDVALVEPQNISLRVGKDKLSFQLYDSRAPHDDLPTSARCDALLAGARLGLLHKYQRRKQKLIDNPLVPSQSILFPLVNLLQFAAACRTVSPVLQGFADALSAAGRPTKLVARFSACESPDAVVGLLAARTKVDVLGAVYTLEIEECPGLTVTVTAPAVLSVTTPRATFPLRDADGLAPLAADAVATQLSALAYPVVREAAGGESVVFFDELDQVVIAGSLGPLSITLPAPYDRVLASVESAAVEGYDSADASQSLDEWLGDLGRAAVTES
ncbi:hypothetical protein CC85DRAFT_328422 [Cutaneotrichosporon oleaginosum]|uniref:Mediator of RNA polymerase II transcription subunit 17 n=1 Tax=Cutaneotrichosporon oleaginosum TaxID=879819 RepID=A0A0J0XM52_9TREE|nr:uncharacterized protein CC85DRAFT_328422 [Cutaneotrichosporon oleaginosum]KLT42192.1 hypothetical protein CC85DRAFT_328422 [Cutaneotrichosporon oleaginosum]TXT11689.1 hypothetical protein COLE_02099 [Cutaneotrichosporon oleaginosum]